MPKDPDSSRRDPMWIALLSASFVYGLAVSWQRWGNPLIDTGREMNVPLRLVNGEVLYSDIRHIYGPLSPWINAWLYRTFGSTLTVLYADGIACATIAIALVYWLSRQLMRPAAAGTATVTLTWLCVFKPSGNYILPYSFNAVHATVLGLATLAVLTRAVRAAMGSQPADGRIRTNFLVAGVLAGLTLLAKTELGIAAMAGGMVAAPLAAAAGRTRTLGLMGSFFAPLLGLTALAYGTIAARVGWSTLVNDSWFLALNLPPELASYNRHLAGLDRPLYSAWRVLLACIKLGIVAAIVAASSALAAGPAPQIPGERRVAPRFRLAAFVLERPRRSLVLALAIAVVLSLTTGLDWDKGPYLAMPVLLATLIVVEMRTILRDGLPRANAQPALLLLYAVYALVSLGRLALHVQSGGGYGSFLLPVSIVIFTYLWVGPFVDTLDDRQTADVARRYALALLLLVAIVSAALLGVKYRTRDTVRIASPRGTMIAEREVGVAWNEALAYIEAHTRPGDPIAVLPEGTSLTFLSGRRNPLREEIVTPGFLDGASEARAIRQLQEADTQLVLIANRPTAEFGPNAFGRDYCVELMRWIQSHYQPCAMFGVIKDATLQVGDPRFFIRAYCPADGFQSRRTPTEP
jgi:hypothetical protein